MTFPAVKYNTGPARVAMPPIRGIRAASIPVAAGVSGTHLIRWVGAYQFGLFNTLTNSAGTQVQLGSLIHNNVGSRGINQAKITGGRAAYFNSDAALDTSLSDETLQEVNSSLADPIQVGLFGANKLACSLYVTEETSTNGATFTLALYRMINTVDNTAFMANNADSSMLVNQWAFNGQAHGTNSPQLNFAGVTLTSGCSFYLELANITNPQNVNMMAGDVFLHS